MHDFRVGDCLPPAFPDAPPDLFPDFSFPAVPQCLAVSPSVSLFHADCFDVLPSLPEAGIDLVLCDPPYGTTNLAFDKVKIDWAAWWAEIHRVAAPTAIIACFAAQPFTTDLINSNRKNYRYDLVWQKTNPVGFLSANVRPLRSHESILIFCRRFGARRERQGEHLVRRMQSIYNPQFTEGTPYFHRSRSRPASHYSALKDVGSYQNEGRRFPTSVLTYARDVPSTHPTAKPVALGRWMVRTFSHRGQTVLDPFVGGGSLALAALEEGRNVVAMEKDAVHYRMAQERLFAALAR